MTWGGLNPALTSWRNGLNALLPGRSTRSDGGRADSNHSSSSEHQADADGTVDAFDEDRNYLASSDQDGNAAEDRIHAALNADFMADPRAHLIISDRTIRNDQIGNWKARPYTYGSPHTEHTHRQVHQSREHDSRAWKFTRTRALLEELSMPTANEIADAMLTKLADALETKDGETESRLARALANTVWYKRVNLPLKPGETTVRSVHVLQILQWLDNAELDTRRQILEAVAASDNEADALARIESLLKPAQETPPPVG